jgi:hypothetical protein
MLSMRIILTPARVHLPLSDSIVVLVQVSIARFRFWQLVSHCCELYLMSLSVPHQPVPSELGSCLFGVANRHIFTRPRGHLRNSCCMAAQTSQCCFRHTHTCSNLDGHVRLYVYRWTKPRCVQPGIARGQGVCSWLHHFSGNTLYINLGAVDVNANESRDPRKPRRFSDRESVQSRMYFWKFTRSAKLWQLCQDNSPLFVPFSSVTSDQSGVIQQM